MARIERARVSCCVNCGETLPPLRFARRCDACVATRQTTLRRERRLRNPEATRAAKRAWRRQHDGRYLASHRAWKNANRARLAAYKRAYDKQRKQTDPVFKLITYLRSRVAAAIRASRLKGKRVTAVGALRYLGCSFDHFSLHIESQFTNGMSWENFGKGGWHIDHIYPLARADFTDPVELWAALNWRNCRPLWEAENMTKNAKITPEAAELFATLKAQAAREIADDGDSR